MTQQDISVALENRTIVRKGLRALRNQGRVPAVVHDHGNRSLHVSGDYTVLAKAYELAGKHHPVQLTVDGKKHLAIIKDADFDVVKRRLRHVVFQAITQNEKVTTEVPIVFAEGDIPAVRKGLIVLQQLDVAEVEAFPRNLPDQLIVDATSLAADGDRLTVSDIVVPTGVAILSDAEQVIAMVETPKDQIAAADASAADLAADAGTSAAEEVAEEAPEAKG